MINKNILELMLRNMLKIRYFENQVDQFYMQGEAHGTGHLYTGMEAVAVGIISALKEKDIISSNHCGHGHCIAKGADINRMMAELLGSQQGIAKAREVLCILLT